MKTSLERTVQEASLGRQRSFTEAGTRDICVHPAKHGWKPGKVQGIPTVFYRKKFLAKKFRSQLSERYPDILLEF